MHCTPALRVLQVLTRAGQVSPQEATVPSGPTILPSFVNWRDPGLCHELHGVSKSELAVPSPRCSGRFHYPPHSFPNILQRSFPVFFFFLFKKLNICSKHTKSKQTFAEDTAQEGDLVLGQGPPWDGQTLCEASLRKERAVDT